MACSPPPNVPNGVIVGNNYEYGAMIAYECNQDHVLVGSRTRVCIGTSSYLYWSEINPTCSCKNLLSKEYMAINKYVIFVSMLIIWSILSLTVVCPCEPGGRCSNPGSEFICECDPGKTGNYCESGALTLLILIKYTFH